jgi:hypothetical protein
LFKVPKNNEKYAWTWHVIEKMKYYKLSPSLVKRVIRYPERTEEGIAPETIASMKVAKTKKRQEIWVMYKPATRANSKSQKTNNKNRKIRIITAWRYPGESPERNPVPEEILNEVKELL